MTGRLHINNTVLRYMFAIVFLLLALGFCGLSIFADGQRNDYDVLTQVEDGTSHIENKVYAQIDIAGRWMVEHEYKTQYMVTLVNEDDKDIENWEISFVAPTSVVVDEKWNCEYSYEQSNGILKLSPNEYNTLIKAGEQETISIKTTTPIIFEPDMVTITVKRSYGMEDYILYKILIIASIIYVALLLLYLIIQSRIETYRQQNEENEKIIVQALNTFANFVDAKDRNTQGHSTRVAYYSRELARRMKFTKDVQRRIYYIALMHDVGKVAVPRSILNKPGKLTPEEIEEMRMHTLKGAEMLKDFTALSGIAEGARYHHERYDGTGYPMKLAGNDIPLYARIIGVADAFDVMSHGRCYTAARSKENIIKELNDNAGTQFDPKIVKYMIELIEDMDELDFNK